MNYNYVGSLAERFIQFRSGVLAASETETDLFNAMSVYIPSNVIADNLIDVVAPATADEFKVVKVTFDNYKEVMKGELLRQFSPVLKDGTNVEFTLFLIVFYVPDGTGSDTVADYLTVAPLEIVYTPLKKAFDELFFASVWKVLFSPNSDGETVSGGYDDQYYFDFSLALAQLCAKKSELSFFLSFVRIKFPLATVDTNKCKIASMDRGVAISSATALDMAPTTEYPVPRTNLYIGMLNLVQSFDSWVGLHSERFNVFSEVIGLAYSARNESGTFIGNKLAKIRLTGANIKATGVPSPLDSDVNVNIPRTVAERLDSLYVSYLLSIAGDTKNNAMLNEAKAINGVPVIAKMIARWIDYNTSQQLAKIIADQSTLRNPILKNENTYVLIQNVLLNNLQRFAKNGRIVNIAMDFPQYTQLPESTTDIIVSAAWSADYVSDIGRITISGTIVV
jgi:hypothetical protein